MKIKKLEWDFDNIALTPFEIFYHVIRTFDFRYCLYIELNYDIPELEEIKCDSFAHGKQLAQEDFEKRVKACMEET